MYMYICTSTRSLKVAKQQVCMSVHSVSYIVHSQAVLCREGCLVYTVFVCVLFTQKAQDAVLMTLHIIFYCISASDFIFRRHDFRLLYIHAHGCTCKQRENMFPRKGALQV